MYKPLEPDQNFPAGITSDIFSKVFDIDEESVHNICENLNVRYLTLPEVLRINKSLGFPDTTLVYRAFDLQRKRNLNNRFDGSDTNTNKLGRLIIFTALVLGFVVGSVANFLL